MFSSGWESDRLCILLCFNNLLDGLMREISFDIIKPVLYGDFGLTFLKKMCCFTLVHCRNFECQTCFMINFCCLCIRMNY